MPSSARESASAEAWTPGREGTACTSVLQPPSPLQALPPMRHFVVTKTLIYSVN